MQLTVLGTGTIAFDAKRSCSSYYVEAGGARILMDCGAGTTRRLAELGIDWHSLTHIVISHFHIDHHQDLPSILFAWKYGQLPPRSAPVDVIGPVGTKALLEKLAAAYGEWVLAPGYDVRITEIAPDGSVDLGGATLTCTKVPHTPESVAYSITENSRRLVYSADTGFDPAFAQWARHCDLLVLECSLPASMAIPEHLTPEQCAEVARLAEPRRLALTHLYPPVESVDIAGVISSKYNGPVVIAHDGWSTTIEE
jgi:ribonuclease BN (tRNA processing enzyme)